MTEAEQKYIEIIRQKTGEERLKIAMDLRHLALKMTEAGIKDKNPKVSSKEIKKLLQERIYGFSFPFGNSGRKIR